MSGPRRKPAGGSEPGPTNSAPGERFTPTSAAPSGDVRPPSWPGLSPDEGPPASAAAVEAYESLLVATRGLAPDAAEARSAWLSRLGLSGAAGSGAGARSLFELEMLLKGLACYANPRNHPGPPHDPRAREEAGQQHQQHGRVASRDFREPLLHAEAGLSRALSLARTLADAEGGRVARRYLAPVLLKRPAAPAAPMGTPSPAAGGPASDVSRALLELREGLAAVLEATRAAAQLPRVPFRVFAALLGLVRKATEQSTYFNPLRQLEYRAEFDRPTDPALLALPGAAATPAARTLVALTVLALARMQRYVALIEETARSGAPHAERRTGIVFLLVSVLRSDARALVEHLEHRAGDALATDYEAALATVPARTLAQRFEALKAEATHTTELRAGFESIAARLRLDVRATFGRDFPSPYGETEAPALRDAATLACTALSEEISAALARLAEVLGKGRSEAPAGDPLLDGLPVGALGPGGARGRHLQRDAWMFAQVLRAFASKARSAAVVDGLPQGARTSSGSVPPARLASEVWSSPPSGEFVAPFLTYVRALGLPVLARARYPRRAQFLGSVAALLRDGATAREPLLRVVAEAGPLTTFLLGLVDDLDRALGDARESERERDRGHQSEPFEPFQPREAAEALRRRLEMATTAARPNGTSNEQSAEGR